MDIGVVCLKRERFGSTSRIKLYVLPPYGKDFQVCHAKVPKVEAAEHVDVMLGELIDFVEKERLKSD